MKYSSSFCNIQNLKDRIAPVDFYEHEQENLGHKRSLWVEAGLCPFHDDRSAGSFFINTQSGGYKCFSCDASGGDIISYAQKKYEMSFKDAIKKLKSEWRIS